MKKEKKKYIKLKNEWQKHFDGLKFDEKLSKNKNKYHDIYNKSLRSFLVECQEKEFFPSKDYMTNFCQELQTDIKKQISLNGADVDRKDYNLIDLSIDNMDFTEATFTHTEDGEQYKNGGRLVIFGLIPVKSLTENEIGLINRCFLNDGKINDYFLTVTLIDVIFSGSMTENKMDKIKSYIKRVAREKFNKFANDNNEDTGFKYSRIQKLKDSWLDSGI
jgi:hypothetical protein